MNALTFFIVFVILLVIVLLIINRFISVHKPNAEKVSPYECGFVPLGTARDKFSVQFFLVAILFILFDLEVIFLFPLAVSLYEGSLLAFWTLICFLVILTIGFVYELSKGVLKFTPKH